MYSKERCGKGKITNTVFGKGGGGVGIDLLFSKYGSYRTESEELC